MSKKTFLMTMRVKDCLKEFKEGLGPGVLVTQELSFDLPPDYVPSLLAAEILRQEEDFINKHIEVITESVGTTKKLALKGALKHSRAYVVTDFPKLKTHCYVCGEVQHDTPGGPCCKQGHGGAPAVEEYKDCPSCKGGFTGNMVCRRCDGTNRVKKETERR